jgi:predicted nucleic acid-binding protein
MASHWVARGSLTGSPSMSGVAFVDSNILIYAHDQDAGSRRDHARAVCERLWQDRSGRLSVQVLQEFYVTVTRKLRTPVVRAQARELVRAYASWVVSPTTPETVLRATEVSEASGIGFWDALIVASAEQSGADILYSEDLNDRQVIAGVRVVNPLRLT